MECHPAILTQEQRRQEDSEPGHHGQHLLEARRANLLRLRQDLEEDDVEDGARGERHDDLDGHRARAVLGGAVVDEVADREPEGGRAGKDT